METLSVFYFFFNPSTLYVTIGLDFPFIIDAGIFSNKNRSPNSTTTSSVINRSVLWSRVSPSKRARLGHPENRACSFRSALLGCWVMPLRMRVRVGRSQLE